MLQGFEHETAELTPKETELLPVIIAGLSTKVGSSMAVTNKQICTGLLNNCGVKITEPRIRKIIAYIRHTGIIRGLIATSDGYYISKDMEEVKKYIGSLHGRQAAMIGIKQQMCKYLQDLAAYNPTAPVSFQDDETASVYQWMQQRLSPEQLPPYNHAFIAGLTHAIHCNFYYHYITKQDPAFINSLRGYFLSVDAQDRADIITGQIDRAKNEFLTFDRPGP